MINEKKELQIVRQLIDQFNEKINYCHWKSNQHFGDALVGIDDLDILIDRTQYNQVIDILQELKYKRFYIPDARSYVGIEDYLGFDYETGKLIHLHLHSQLVVGEKHLKGYLLPIEYWVLKNRRWDEEHKAYLSSYHDELLLLILRLAMKVRKRDIIKKSLMGSSLKNEYEWLREKALDFDRYINNQEWLSDRIKKLIMEILNGV